jgi:hypothetical protein
VTTSDTIEPPPPPPHLPPYPPLDTHYADLVKAAYDVELKRATADQDAIDAQNALLDQTDVALVREFHESVRDVAKTALANADALPQLVITAAGAIVTLYTGVLALVFAAGGNALPARALIPALFLGGAVALATGYAGYITKVGATNFMPDDHVWPNAVAHTNGFTAWINAAINSRAGLMRGAVFALALGVLFLPSAFINVQVAVPIGTPGMNAAESLAPWPSPPTVDARVTGDVQKTLYQAQVAEVAQQRSAALKSSSANSFDLGDVLLWGAAIVLGVLAWRQAEKAST